MLQLDKEVVQERQERYAQHAPKRVQKALCAEVFGALRITRQKQAVKTQTNKRRKTGFFLLRKEHLASSQVATSGHTRMQWLNRVFDFPVQEAADVPRSSCQTHHWPTWILNTWSCVYEQVCNCSYRSQHAY